MEVASSKALNSQNEAPLVTLIILTYERLEYLKEALKSAVNQTYRNLEIIVSDNCSRVNPADLVASFQDSRLRLRRNPTNLGTIGNYLSAVKEAQGKYVTFLHDDDLFDKDFLIKLVSVMEADPEIVLAFSDHYFIDTAGSINQAGSEQSTRVFKKDLRPGKHKPFYEPGLLDRTISGMDTVFRREAINWDDLPTTLAAGVDLYLVYLFALTNQAAFYCPERLTLNRIHPGQQTVTSTFPRGLVMCYNQFVSDPRLAAYKTALQRDLTVSQTFLGIALIKQKKPQEARRYLMQSLRQRWSLRALAALGLSFIPFKLVFPTVVIYKRVKKALHIKNEFKFTN